MCAFFNKPEHMILWVAPFYNRSGYGVGARSAVIALHKAGVKIKVMSVNEVEPGLDDVDMKLIKSLEDTPLEPPVTAIVSHVPSPTWLNIALPEPHVRIISTTFDGSAQGLKPPKQWMDVFEHMDQIWIEALNELKLFENAGIPWEKLRHVAYPHPWKDNDILPPARPDPFCDGSRFRFLSIAMYQPRRRWDTLIEAFLQEFKDEENVELYLKVNYPHWHPVPGKPRQDLHNLVNGLKSKIDSKAKIVIDEDLGKRSDILKLMDSCNVYVTTDTAPTAPTGEARARNRLIVAPEGLFILPEDHDIQVTIPVDPDARTPMTPEMLQYQPHHKGIELSILKVEDVRGALRKAYTMPADKKTEILEASYDCVPGPTQTVPMALESIEQAWRRKIMADNKAFDKRKTRIAWEGSQFVYHSLGHGNREHSLRLIDAGFDVSIIPYEKHQYEPEAGSPYIKIKDRMNKPLESVDVHVRHQWPPKLESPAQGHWVVMQPWEFGSLPRKWVDVFATHVDECWVCSHYVRDVYIESGVPADRVFLVPYGFDPAKYHPQAAPYPLKTKKSFKFLFIGGTLPRKGIDILIDVYTRTFTADDDVCLVIKDMGGETFYKGINQVQRLKEMAGNPNLPDMEYIDGNLPEEELIGLYTASDVLVHPYRGEGFGLPILEASACGTPAIVTNGGACLDFCDQSTSYLVNADRIIFHKKFINDMELVNSPWMLEPDPAELRDAMLEAFHDSEKRIALGKTAQEFVHANYTWELASEIMQNRIRQLLKKPVLRETLAEAADDDPFAGYGPAGSASNTAQDGLKPVDRQSRKAEAFYSDALLALSSDKTERAVELLKKTLQVNPKHAKALNQYGLIEYKNNNIDEALKRFEAAMIADRSLLDARRNYAELLLAKEDYAKGIKTLGAILADYPNDVPSLISMGKLSIKTNRVRDALVFFEKALQIEPGNETAVHYRNQLTRVKT